MEYNSDKIVDNFRLFWQKNKGKMRYQIGSKEVLPESVSSFHIQLKEGDYGDGYNFKCETLNLRVMIDDDECPYDAEFIIKVSYKASDNCKKPNEFIESIKDNTIFLKKR